MNSPNESDAPAQAHSHRFADFTLGLEVISSLNSSYVYQKDCQSCGCSHTTKELLQNAGEPRNKRPELLVREDVLKILNRKCTIAFYWRLGGIRSRQGFPRLGIFKEQSYQTSD